MILSKDKRNMKYNQRRASNILEDKATRIIDDNRVKELKKSPLVHI